MNGKRHEGCFLSLVLVILNPTVSRFYNLYGGVEFLSPSLLITAVAISLIAHIHIGWISVV